MQEIYVEDIKKIIPVRKKLEKKLQVKITNRGKDVFVDGNAKEEYTAIEVLEAVNCGFSVNHALFLTEENNILQRVNIKDITKRHDLERIRARIIGTKGKTLKTLSNLSNCLFSLKENNIGIIGDAEAIEDAKKAIESIIIGSKQANVYSYLEKQNKKRRLESKFLLKQT